MTGSREAQDEEPDGETSGFDRAARALDVIVGREIVELSIDRITGDLILDLAGQYQVRTFVSDPRTDELWHIRDNVTHAARAERAVFFRFAPRRLTPVDADKRG